VSFQSVSITGANPGDFEERTTAFDGCAAAEHSCTIFVIYAPTSVGSSLATLNVNETAQ